MRRSRILLILLVSLIFSSINCTTILGAGENLAENPSFNTDTNGWLSRYGATVTWDANG